MILYNIIILIFLNTLAFYERHIVLYALMGMGDIIFGCIYAILNWTVQWTDTFTVGLMVIILGVFMVVRAGMKGWDKYVGKK